MKKNDMYIDYSRRRRGGNTGLRVIAVIAVIILAGGIGFGGYCFTKYYIDATEEQTVNEALSPTPISVAEAMTGEDDTDNSETGIYGLWSSSTVDTDEAETESIYDNLDGEVWMADFVDTRTRVNSKGIYLSAQKYNSKLEDAIALIESTELNTIVIDIKSDYGTISYQMDCELAREAGALSWTIKDVDALLTRLHDKGIYVIARVVTMKDPVISKYRPDLCMTMPDGTLYKDNTGYTWMNPYKSEVWDYLIDICRCVAEAGFDEINLDYIRFSTDKGYLDIDYGPESEGVSKTEAITNGVKRLCEEIKPLGVFISCDLFGAVMSSSVDSKLVGQSYFQLAQYLDYLCPMIYPSHYGDGYYNLDYPDCHPYELIYSALMDSRKILYMIDDTGNKADVRPWLQDFTASWIKHHITYGAEEVRTQIQAVYDTGYSGWLLWNASINYTKAALLPPE